MTATNTPLDKTTILAVTDFSRARLLGTLDAIEKSGHDLGKILAWRPGPGRAHIGWQAMHCAATHDRYLNVGLRGGQPVNEETVAAFGGGSVPSDANVPSLPVIREALTAQFADLKNYIEGLSPTDLAHVKLMGKVERSVGESLILLAWHEAHHQGQIHLTWNMYKAASGIG